MLAYSHQGHLLHREQKCIFRKVCEMLVSCLVKGLDQTNHWKGQMVAALEGVVWVLSYDKSSELEEWWAAALR